MIPLFTSDWTFSHDHFYSAANAVVYLQFGDSPKAYENPNFRRILAQAIQWASSAEAKAWALEVNST